MCLSSGYFVRNDVITEDLLVTDEIVLKQLPSLWMKYFNLFCSFMTWSDSLRLIHHICSLTYPFLRQAGWF